MEKIIEAVLIVIIGIIVCHFYYDIFRLRRNNKKLRRMAKIKSEFITMTVHQLRTPLAKVKWILYSAANGDLGSLNKEQKDALESAYNANQNMVNLLNDLLEMSKSEDVDLGYKFAKSSIGTVVEGTVKSFALAARQKKINLVLNKATDSIPEITMDSHKIGLAVGNLIDNAIKYTPEGGSVEVSLENLGDRVKVSVKDSGIGIPKEEQGKIFTEFFRAKNAASVKEDGTGLGLYIVKNIVKIHGGNIGFESEEGKGSVFHFTVPFRREEEIKKGVDEFVDGI